MGKREIKDFHTRFTEMLSLNDDTDIEQVKSKYFYLVEKFIEEYFICEKEISTKELLDKSFMALKSGIESLDLRDIEDFHLGISALIMASVNLKGGRLKVSEGFFADQLINSFAMRAISFTSYSSRHSKFILSGLRSVGISHNDSIEMFEIAMDWAEANEKYSFSEKSYIINLIHALIKLGKEKGVSLKEKILMPKKFMQQSKSYSAKI
jgi:hypothetical protein